MLGWRWTGREGVEAIAEHDASVKHICLEKEKEARPSRHDLVVDFNIGMCWIEQIQNWVHTCAQRFGVPGWKLWVFNILDSLSVNLFEHSISDIL